MDTPLASMLLTACRRGPINGLSARIAARMRRSDLLGGRPLPLGLGALKRLLGAEEAEARRRVSGPQRHLRDLEHLNDVRAIVACLGRDRAATT